MVNQIVTPTQLLSSYQYLPNETERYSGSAILSKYMSGIESTLKLSANISNSEYYNRINASTLRKNSALMNHIKLFYKTAFDGKINFEKVLNYNTITSKSKDIIVEYNNKSFSNRFKTISYLRNDLLFFNGYTYYRPNISSNQTYHFINSTFRYRPKEKDWSVDLLVDNILNEDENKNVNTNDYSETIQSYQKLLRRF